jgi:cytochrome P450
MATRPLHLLDWCARRYGDCFTLRPPVGAPVVLFSHPEAIREIFTADADTLRGGAANDYLRPILGFNSLLLLDGERHTRERRLLLPPFHGQRMLEYSAVIREVTDAAIDTWPLREPISMQQQMQNITLEIILRTAFGIGRNTDHRILRTLLSRLIAAAVNPFLLWKPLQRDLGPLTPWARFRRLKREIDTLLREEIARRRAQTDATATDILSMLIAARDEDGAPMRADEIADEMVTVLLAGHETTATALSWALQRILSTPDARARLCAELRTGAAAEPWSLPYLDATVKETLRLNPVIPDVGRVLSRSARIHGRDLPAGVAASACIYLTQRRPEVWLDPLRFAPERFLDARPSPYEYFPFGGGMRRCIGMAFAQFEMKIVLARLLSRLELELAPSYRARVVRRSITLAPSRGTPVVVAART